MGERETKKPETIMEYIESDDGNMPGGLVDFTYYASSHQPMVHGPLVECEVRKVGDG